MESSGTTSRTATTKRYLSRNCETAGPDRSCRSPRAQESLTVTTAAVSSTGSAIEEDIFLFLTFGPSKNRSRRRCRTGGKWRRGCGRRRFGLSFCATVALRFVQKPQAFHQQSLGVELGRLFVGLAFKVELEISSGPAQHLEDCRISHQRAVGRVLHLTFCEEDFALVAFVAERKLAALASHLQRL